jgi:hypothetical protein
MLDMSAIISICAELCVDRLPALISQLDKPDDDKQVEYTQLSTNTSTLTAIQLCHVLRV